MVFAGEASWRWRMLRPSGDRAYEWFWRQTARWLTAGAPDPVMVSVSDASEAGDAVELAIDARDPAFAPAADALVEVTVTLPGGEHRSLAVRREAGAAGRFTAAFRAEQPGLYRAHAEARRGTRSLGASDRWFHVGGADREFADPRLNEAFLARVAHDTGGQYVRAADAGKVAAWLEAAVPQTLEPERRELWQAPWAFALVIGLLTAEWALRRRWGLR
jgi:hypothetical protein